MSDHHAVQSEVISGTVMTQEQRDCLLHVLRNVTSSLLGTTLLVEDKRAQLTYDDLLRCLEGIPQTLTQVIEALRQGTFCPLTSEKCEFVGPHIGCHRSCPVPGRNSQQVTGASCLGSRCSHQ